MINTNTKLETFMEYHNSKFFVGVGGSSGSGSVLSVRFGNRREPSRGVGKNELIAVAGKSYKQKIGSQIMYESYKHEAVNHRSNTERLLYEKEAHKLILLETGGPLPLPLHI